VATNESLEEAIKAKAQEIGFVACGFARADAAPEAGPRLLRWLDEGRHGPGWTLGLTLFTPPFL
jgi:epoxyqueuosine reductase